MTSYTAEEKPTRCLSQTLLKQAPALVPGGGAVRNPLKSLKPEP